MSAHAVSSTQIRTLKIWKGPGKHPPAALSTWQHQRQLEVNASRQAPTVVAHWLWRKIATPTPKIKMQRPAVTFDNANNKADCSYGKAAAAFGWIMFKKRSENKTNPLWPLQHWVKKNTFFFSTDFARIYLHNTVFFFFVECNVFRLCWLSDKKVSHRRLTMREMGRTVTAGDCLAPPPTCSSKNVWRKAQCPCRCHAMSVRLPSVSLPGPLASLRITVCWGGVRQILPTHPGIWAPSRCTRCQPSCDWLWCQRAARCQMRRGIKSSIRSRIQYLHGIYASPPCDLSDLLCQSKKINMWYWFWNGKI